MKVIVLFLMVITMSGCVVIPVPSPRYYSVVPAGNYPPPYPQARQIVPENTPPVPQPPVVYQPVIVQPQPVFVVPMYPVYPVYDSGPVFWFRFGGHRHRH